MKDILSTSRVGFVKEINGKPIIVDLEELEGGLIDKGHEGDKHFRRVYLNKHGKRREVGIMVEKGESMEPPEDVLLKFNILTNAFNRAVKEGSFSYNPLPQTLRMDENADRLLISDETEGGKYLIIDRHNPPSSVNLRINLEERNRIEDMSQKIAEIALAAGVVLDDDAYMIKYNPLTKEYRVKLLDIGYLSSITRVIPGTEDYEYYQGRIKRNVRSFINNLTC